MSGSLQGANLHSLHPFVARAGGVFSLVLHVKCSLNMTVIYYSIESESDLHMPAPIFGQDSFFGM